MARVVLIEDDVEIGDAGIFQLAAGTRPVAGIKPHARVVPDRADLAAARGLQEPVHLVHPRFEIVRGEPSLIPLTGGQTLPRIRIGTQQGLRGGNRTRAPRRIGRLPGTRGQGVRAAADQARLTQHAGGGRLPERGVVRRGKRQQQPPLGLRVAVRQQHVGHPIAAGRDQPGRLGGPAALTIVPPRQNLRAAGQRLNQKKIL